MIDDGHLWAMTPAAISAVLQARADAEAPSEAQADRSHISREVAVVPLHGLLRPRSTPSLFGFQGQATAIDAATTAFKAALKNPDIRSIVLEIDSPGGILTGISEFATLVFAARRRKPITAYVTGTATAGAYWIAAAAEKVVVDEIALLGGIGIASTFLDTSKAEKRAGIGRIEIVSSQSPQKRLDPATKAGKSAAQRLVDDLAAVFIARVAQYRAVSEATVISKFGQGGVLVGQRAIDAGLADRLGSLDALLTQPLRDTPMSTPSIPIADQAPTHQPHSAQESGLAFNQAIQSVQAGRRLGDRNRVVTEIMADDLENLGPSSPTDLDEQIQALQEERLADAGA